MAKQPHKLRTFLSATEIVLIAVTIIASVSVDIWVIPAVINQHQQEFQKTLLPVATATPKPTTTPIPTATPTSTPISTPTPTTTPTPTPTPTATPTTTPIPTSPLP